MTSMLVKFDADYQQSVVEVRSLETGELKKFIYDEEEKTLLPAADVVVVKTCDLQLVYEVPCRRHYVIAFCRNFAKGGQVFKYAQSEYGRLQRVQCSCCFFDEERSLDLEIYMSEFNFKSDFVDEDSNNHVHLRPCYSKFCDKQKEMVIFASTRSDNEEIESFLFDPKTERFRTNRCRCAAVCREPDAFRETLELGAQQMNFARSHLDKFGRALLCLSIDWYDNENGKMNVFCDANGEVGRYRFDEEIKRFDLVKLLKVRMRPMVQPVEPQRVMFDDEIDFKYSVDCPTLGETIFFSSHRGKIHKLLFNSIYMQFESVKCDDCQYDANEIEVFNESRKTVLGLYYSHSSFTPLALVRTETGWIEKRLRIGKHFVEMEPSPVRYLEHESPQEIHQRRHFQKRSQYSRLVSDEDNQGYYTLGQDLMVDLTGRVIPLHPDPSETSGVDKPETLMDSDLKPQRIGYCEHLKTAVISALNSYNNSSANYIFDTIRKEVRQIHCCQVSEDRRLAVPKETLTISCDHICPVFVCTDEMGHLVKQLYDRSTDSFVAVAPKPVVRTFEWETFPENHISASKPAGSMKPARPAEVKKAPVTTVKPGKSVVELTEDYKVYMDYYFAILAKRELKIKELIQNKKPCSASELFPETIHTEVMRLIKGEPRDAEDRIEVEIDDVASVHTALAPSDVEDDAESTSTAIEDELAELEIVSDSDGSSDGSWGLEDVDNDVEAEDSDGSWSITENE